jgi:hypothetical protein
MVQTPGEEPIPESRRVQRSLTPGRFTGSPKLDRGPPQREATYLSGFGGVDLFCRCSPLNGEHPTLQVAETKGHQLPSPRTGVGCQAHQESHLLRLVQRLKRAQSPVERAHGLFGDRLGRLDQCGDIEDRHVHSSARSRRPAQSTDRIALEDRFGLGPPESRSENPKPPRHDGYSGTRLLPPGHRFTDGLRPKRRDPPLRNGVGGQRLDVGAGGTPRRWSPVVMGRQPPLEQIAHREDRRSAPGMAR